MNGVYIGTLRVITWNGKTRLILRHSGESFKRFLSVLPEGMTLENLPDPLMNQQLHKLVKNSAVRCWRKNFLSKGEYHDYLEALGYSRKYINHALWG